MTAPGDRARRVKLSRAELVALIVAGPPALAVAVYVLGDLLGWNWYMYATTIIALCVGAGLLVRDWRRARKAKR